MMDLKMMVVNVIALTANLLTLLDLMIKRKRKIEQKLKKMKGFLFRIFYLNFLHFCGTCILIGVQFLQTWTFADIFLAYIFRFSCHFLGGFDKLIKTPNEKMSAKKKSAKNVRKNFTINSPMLTYVSIFPKIVYSI